MKNWYIVQENTNINHRGVDAKEGEYLWLNEVQVKILDKGVAIADKPPTKIKQVTAAADFNEWKESEKTEVSREAKARSKS